MDASDAMTEPGAILPGSEVDKPIEDPAKSSGASRRLEIDWQAITKSPGFIPGVALAIGIFAAFWYLIAGLPTLWLADDGYYSHGFLVPPISAYVVYRWWPQLRNIKVKPTYLAAIPLLLVLWVTRAAVVNQIDSLTSVCLIAALLCATAFIGGWRWMAALSLPIMYLGFALPLWNMAITVYTNPLQLASTKAAYMMLEITGFHPLKTPGSTDIYLDGYTLNVGVPCSGFKLVIALYAFTIFFALIARLRWWANVILIVLVPIPLALLINGFRIMLIGVVGVNYGPQAGAKFHDYSGYISLVVCFFFLFRIARWLGWKD